jgi:nitroreductase/FMN reductase [NAD(P)H]
MTQALAKLIERRYGLETRLDLASPVPPALATMLGRRSCRRYLAQPVPEALLEVLLACAQSAPSKSDLQQYAIIVVKDPDIRAAIAGLTASMPWIADAPVFLMFCADMRRNRRITELRGHAFANDNLDSFVNATADAALAMGGFVAAAEAAGLGCCPISLVRNHIEAVSTLLALPDGVYPLAGLCAGYPASTGQVSMRLPPGVVVHTDRYDDSRLAAEIDAYDRRRHARRPIPPEKQRHTDHYGVLDRCHWSDNVARQLSRPERANFKNFLNRHGFGLA